MKTLLGLAVLLLVPVAIPEQTPGKIQVGVCTGLDKLDAAQAAGFDYAEISVSRLAALPEDEFQSFLQHLGKLHIPVPAANSFLPADIKIVGPEADPARQLEYVSKAFGRLKKVGVSVVVFGSGGARRVPEGYPREDAFRQLVDFCRSTARPARDSGIVVAVEPLRHQETNIINTVQEGLKLVQAVDLPEIKLLVDYYHLAVENENPAILLEAAKYIVHTHIANPQGRVYPLSMDESGYAGFFENLCKIGYARRISVEASTPDFAAQAPRTIALLRSGLACMPK